MVTEEGGWVKNRKHVPAKSLVKCAVRNGTPNLQLQFRLRTHAHMCVYVHPLVLYLSVIRTIREQSLQCALVVNELMAAPCALLTRLGHGEFKRAKKSTPALLLKRSLGRNRSVLRYQCSKFHLFFKRTTLQIQ